MAEVILKKEFNDLMNIKGEVRGVAIKEHIEFVFEEKGEKGVRRIEEAITKAGFPIKYKEIKPMNFYQVGLEGATLLAIKRIFGFDDKKIQEMGEFEAKLSIIIRLFMKYFASPEKAAKVVPRMWKSYYTIGNLKVIEFDEKKRYVNLRLEDFRLIPVHCQSLIGYFSRLLQMIVGGKVTCEETKCPFRGDEYHEFVMKW